MNENLEKPIIVSSELFLFVILGICSLLFIFFVIAIKLGGNIALLAKIIIIVMAIAVFSSLEIKDKKKI